MISKKELKRKQPSEPGAFNEFRPTPTLPVLHGNSVNENHLLLPKRTARKGTRHVGLPLALSSNNRSKGLRTKDQVQFFVDDDDGHLNFDVGDILEGYTLLGFLGKGSFGRVAKARHIQTRIPVALKIARNTVECRESARSEIAILKRLKQIDPWGKKLWVEMIDNFELQGHTCIALEKLGDSLYSFMKENRFQPYQLDQIRHIAYQICYSVKALHDNRIIHGDLKPENICLESSDFTYGIRPTRQQTYRKPLYAAVRLIDFGCAIDFSDDRYSVLQTRAYRAPEMVCGLTWNYTIDVWSIGCIIFELYTGRNLFPADDDDEHFEVMQEVLGPVPDPYRDTRFVKNHMLKSLPIRKKSCKPLKKCMHLSDKEHQELFNLLGKMLNFNPEERISLCDALKHPFFLLLPDEDKLQ